MLWVLKHPNNIIKNYHGMAETEQRLQNANCDTREVLCSGGASAVKEPGHFEVRKSSSPVTRSQGCSQDFLWGCTFFFKEVNDLFPVVALKTQAATAADCFTVKIKQIKRSDVVTFLFSVHAVTEAKVF